MEYVGHPSALCVTFVVALAGCYSALWLWNRWVHFRRKWKQPDGDRLRKVELWLRPLDEEKKEPDKSGPKLVK